MVQAIGLMMYLWGTVNQAHGAGAWGKGPPLPYQGACYPPACTKLDIQENNIQFYKQFSIPGLPMSSPSPLFSEYLEGIVGEGLDEERFRND